MAIKILSGGQKSTGGLKILSGGLKSAIKKEEPPDLFTGKPKLSALTPETKARSLSVIAPEEYKQQLEDIDIAKRAKLLREYPADYYSGSSAPIEAFVQGVLPTKPKIERRALGTAYPIPTVAGNVAGTVATAIPIARATSGITRVGLPLAGKLYPTASRIVGGVLHSAATGAGVGGIRETAEQIADKEIKPVNIAKEAGWSALKWAPWGIVPATKIGLGTLPTIKRSLAAGGVVGTGSTATELLRKRKIGQEELNNIVTDTISAMVLQGIGARDIAAKNRAKEINDIMWDTAYARTKSRNPDMPDAEAKTITNIIVNGLRLKPNVEIIQKIEKTIKPTLQPETPRPTFTGKPVAPERAITPFTGQPSPLLAQGEKAAYEAALAAKEPFQPRGRELAEAFEQPLHPAPKRIEPSKKEEPVFAGQPELSDIVIQADIEKELAGIPKGIDYTKSQFIEHKGRRAVITPQEIKNYATGLWGEETEMRGEMGKNLLNDIIKQGKINVKFFKGREEIKNIPQFVKLRAFTTNKNAMDLDEMANALGMESDNDLITALQEYKPKGKPKTIEDFYPQALEELTQYKKQLLTQPKTGGKVFRGQSLQPMLKEGEDIAGREAPVRITKDMVITDLQGNKITLPKGEEYTPYPIKDVQGNIKKYLMQDGQRILVAKNQAQNIKNQNIVLGEGQPMAGGKIHRVKLSEKGVGTGSVLNTKTDTDKSIQNNINANIPFTLLGNKAEVISRMSKELKSELTKEIDTVFDLFGGAKGYRAGLFPNMPSENYHLNEFSDERYNYYKNIQNPEALTIIKQNIQQYRNEMIDRIAEGFEISKEKYSPEELRKSLNKWLTRGMNKKRRQFARSIIQEYGDSLLEQAAADKWQSPTSSAIYYFLQNTSVFGIKQTPTGWQWPQGIIRTSGDKTEINDTMRRIEDSDKQLDMESKRDAQMPLTKQDAWQVIDEVTQKINKGELNPKKTVVLVDPQYLNPTQEKGTYSVGQQDAFWEGHKQNLEKHLLPLAQTGVKIIYTNNEDINLTKWLRANKLPYNIEESIGATALRGGRDEIISFINYELSKEYTKRVGAGAVGKYTSDEITGESKQFEKWLAERKRLEREGKIKPPFFGVGWTPQERKDLYIQALNKGLIYKDIYGKEHDKLHGLIKYYHDASFTQLKSYISELTGDRENPPQLFKMFGDITKDAEIMKMLNKVAEKWQDINKIEVASLDPVRIVEKVTGQDLWDDNILANNTFFTITSSDEAMFDRLTKELDELKTNKQGVMKTSKESAEIMRKFEAKESLTDKEQKIVTYLRKKYDALIAEANEMRMRMKKPPIPYRQDYMTHILEQNLLSDFFKGDMDAMKNISAGQLAAIRKGDYTKGNMPFNKFALKRLGKKTRYDAIGNYEAYLKIILKEIYYTPALTHARKFTEYALRKQPNAWKAMDRLFNDLKGKPSIADQNIVGVIAGSKPIKWMRSRIAQNALIGNINFWAINASNFTVSYDELGNYMNKGIAKFLGTKKWRQFAFKNSLMLKNRTIDPDIDPSTFKTSKEVAGYITNLLEYNNVGSTFVGAYHKGIDLGYDKAKAIRYADSIARRTQVGYKKYELNAWMRSNSGMLLSQFQSWSFNSMNHLIYDLKLGNIPDNLKAVFTKQGKKPVRWGAFFMLLMTSMIVNTIYKKAGLRQPYIPTAAVPTIAGLLPSRYNDIGPVRIAKDVGTIFTGKKRETKQRAAIRAASSLALPFGGVQLGRFASGTVFPKQRQEKKSPLFSGQPYKFKNKFPSKFKNKFPKKF